MRAPRTLCILIKRVLRNLTKCRILMLIVDFYVKVNNNLVVQFVLSFLEVPQRLPDIMCGHVHTFHAF